MKPPMMSASRLASLDMLRGIAIAGIDVGESYGSPKGRARGQREQNPAKRRERAHRWVLIRHEWRLENLVPPGIAPLYPLREMSRPG